MERGLWCPKHSRPRQWGSYTKVKAKIFVWQSSLSKQFISFIKNAKVCQRHHSQLTTSHSNYTSGLPLAEGCSWPLQSQKKRIPGDNEPLLLLPRGPQADNNNSEHSQHSEDSVCQAWYRRDPPQKWQQLSVQLQELARFANRHYFYSHNYQSSLSYQLWTDILRLQGSNCSLISMKYYPAQEPVTARNRSNI